MMNGLAQNDQRNPTFPELQRRIVFALLRPVVRLCHLFRFSLNTFEELCRLAYFEELRMRGGQSQAEVARSLGKSLRTIGSLERQYRSDFLAPEAELALAREIEHLFDGADLTLEEVVAQTSHDAEEIQRAVEGLVGMGRLHEGKSSSPKTYQLNRAFVSLVRDDVDAQIDGVQHQLEVIKDAVMTRFYAPDRPALARTLSFVALPDDMDRIGDSLIRHIRQLCIDAEERALKKRSYERYGVTFAFAPTDEEKKTR
jgi:DNA-binding XRE family transcriptional regulator